MLEIVVIVNLSVMLGSITSAILISVCVMTLTIDPEGHGNILFDMVYFVGVSLHVKINILL